MIARTAITARAVDRSVEVLVLLRRIIRATDLHSKRLVKATGLTAPQLVVLGAIRDLGEVTAGRISAQVSLSQATVSSILDRLENRVLIERYRSMTDRRVVHARLTRDGEAALAKAPPPLQEAFVERFAAMSGEERAALVGALRRLADMMDGGDDRPLDALDDPDAPSGFAL